MSVTAEPAFPAMPLVLASGSPQRRRLMEQAGYAFEAAAMDITELAEGIPLVVARENARRKALALSAQRPDALVLGSDTVAALAGRVIGKPRDQADARAILRALSGTTHEVISAVALACGPTGETLVAHDRTAITMRDLSDTEIAAYVAGGEAMGKAGAYAVQEKGDAFVLAMTGAFDTVVGLPMALVASMLRRFGVSPAKSPPTG